MKLHEAKQASSEALKKCRQNGDRVEEIMREADEVEGEVQKFIRRFTRRLERYRARVAERMNAAAASADVGDGPSTEPDVADGEGDK